MKKLIYCKCKKSLHWRWYSEDKEICARCLDYIPEHKAIKSNRTKK